jgi:hypothetical protein
MDAGAKPGNPGRRRALWITGVVVLAVAAAAVTWSVVGRQDPSPAMGDASASGTPAATSSESPAEQRMQAQVDAVLKARASAVLAGRLSQFLEHVDPRNQKLRRQHQQVFTNLRKIGVRQLSYRRETNWVPEKQPQHGTGAQAFRVLMLVQIAGIDPAPRATPLGYTFAERGGRLLLVDDDDLAAELDRGRYREPWDLGAIDVVRKPGVLVVVPSGERGNGQRLARESRAAVPAVRSATRRTQAGILVIAMADRRSMDPGWRTGGHAAAAVAAPNLAPTTADPTEFKVIGSRVVINPDERSEADRLLLAHELTHAAMSPLGHGAPTWLVEGFAEYVELHLAEQSGYRQGVAKRRGELLRDAIPTLAVLPIDGVFHGDYDEESYGVSWIIVEHLVTKYGLTTVNALYADLARGADDPVVREQVLRKHLRISETALVAAVKRYNGPS